MSPAPAKSKNKLQSNEEEIIIVQSSTSLDTEEIENPTKKRKATSEVWNYFTKEKPDANGDLKATCNYCKDKLSGRSSSGTQHLWRHLQVLSVK
ncbi:hypothetical protein PGT21_015230 [Puccinia graminis f. sp. tritici]|uniref:BED-type domain-containing protein n=1 Tax=Puccinia graminis f. sp. tritici TaxID=56615 RepID=A0A5B0RYL3_PUCGR|nr:hypothetical protein PGT21_015230 [Puccinia graminis f. sp. tritici]KAA1130552.1 hypothetical protein PGTUg99_021016 [Puccinia graminis f. sp. tritici]